MSAFESVSTWKHPLPDKVSAERHALLDALARDIVTLKPSRIRVAIDGYTASGKTTFGHQLAAAVRAVGRPTLRASLDDFKRPWRDAIDNGYDRVSGEGYYRNAPDFESARELLLKPAGVDGSGFVALCAHDPLTGIDHRDTVVDAPFDAVLIVDSVFAMRPEYIEFWDFTMWLDVSVDLSLERGVQRDRFSRPGACSWTRILSDRRWRGSFLTSRLAADQLSHDRTRPVCVVSGHRP